MTTDKLILYTNHRCPCMSPLSPSPTHSNANPPICPGAQRAHIALAELDIPFEEVIIDLDTPRTAE